MQGMQSSFSRALFPCRKSPGEGCLPRIFICDDDPDFSFELATGLSSSGFETTTLSDMGSPVQAFARFVPQILMLDIFMPPPDGFEVLNLLHENPALKNTPLILMSGAGTGLLDVAARFCLARGLCLIATFEKPLDLGAIIRICRAHTAGA